MKTKKLLRDRRTLMLTSLALLGGTAGALGACAAEFELTCPEGTVQTAGGGDVGDACSAPAGAGGEGGAPGTGGSPGGAGTPGGGGSPGAGGGGGQVPVPPGGGCSPASTKCEGGAQQTCDAAGQWGAAEACEIGCNGAVACNMPVQLALGGGHACARLSDGSVRCWGSGTSGQLGNGTGEEQLTPKAVPNLSGATDIRASFIATCATLADGTAKCWGANQATNSLSPVDLGAQNAKQVSLGRDNTCVLNSQGLVQCKGAGFYGQLGNLSDEFQGDSSVLVPMLSPNSDPLPIINKLASAANTNFGVTVKNTVLCWGADEPVGNGLCVGNGQNDDFGGTNIAGRPNLISQLNNVISVAAGQGTACAVRADGKVMCWGENDVGQLGRGSHTEREKPALVGGLDAVQQMALGTRHACAATKDGKLFCWGSNRASQLGATCGPTLPCQTTTESESFVAVPRQAFAGVTEIRAGGDFNCVITSPDSKVLCWGSNTSGQLGNGQKGGTEATPKPVVWK